MNNIPNYLPDLPSDEFIIAVDRLRIKAGGATLPKDKFLRSLTKQPPVMLVTLLLNFLRQHADCLMLCDLVQQALARAHNPEFRLYGGYIIIQKIDWDADEVRAHITFCLGESEKDPSQTIKNVGGTPINIKAHIILLPADPLETPPPDWRLLRGKATVGFQPDHFSISMSDVELTGDQ